MATIWDHDVLLFLVSQLVHAQNQGKEISRSLQFTGYEYHQFLRRDWRSGKHAYGLLWDSLRRLHNTHVQTSFYGSDIHHDAEFNWLSQIEQKYSKQTGKHHGFDVVIPEWIYQSVVDVSSRILTLDQTYFDISGGLERWLYLWCRRVSNWGNNHREHIETFDSLYKKSGSTSTKALFDHRLKKIIFSNSIPGYELSYRSGVKGMRRGQGIVVDRDPESLLLVSQAHLLKTQ